MICTHLCLGCLSVCVGDSSRCSEEIVKNLKLRFWMQSSLLLLFSKGKYPIEKLLNLLVFCRQSSYTVPSWNQSCWPSGKATASRAAGLGSIPAFPLDLFPSWVIPVTPVASLSGAWCYRVSAGTGQPGVSILWQSEKEEVWSAISISEWQHKH